MPLVFYSSLHLNLKRVRSFCSFLSTFIGLNSSSKGSCVLFSLDNTLFRLSGEGCSQKVYFHHLLNCPHWTALIYLHDSIHWNDIPPKYRYQCTKRQSVTPTNTVILTFRTVISLNLIFYRHSWIYLPFLYTNILCWQQMANYFCKGLITAISYQPRLFLPPSETIYNSWKWLIEKYFHCQEELIWPQEYIKIVIGK